jgi:rsbT antagonist protein RsbS
VYNVQTHPVPARISRFYGTPGNAYIEVPILERDSCIIACLPSALTDGDLIVLRDTLVERVSRSHPRGVIVDVAALDVMDSFATRTFGDLASKIRRQGAEVVLVGIKPDVSVAALRLGLKLDSVATVVGLDEGIAYLGQKARVSQQRRDALR